MDVALPALVIFLLLFPGFVLRNQAKRSDRERLDYSPFGRIVTEGVTAAGVLHAIWLGATWLWLGRRADMQHLLGLFSADTQVQSAGIAHVAAQAGEIAIYLCSQLVSAWILGRMLRELVVRLHLDRADARMAWLFRFRQAPWYYLLSGLDARHGSIPDLVMLDAVIEEGGRPVTFAGSLADYFLDAEGRLERLVLEAVQRGEAGPAGRFQRIGGDYFVLRYDQVLSLNLRYVTLKFPALLPGLLQGRRSRFLAARSTAHEALRQPAVGLLGTALACSAP